MEQELSNYKKATTLEEVDNAVRFDIPISADHAFFTDFSKVRGDFEDKLIYRVLNVNSKTFVFNRKSNIHNRTLLFLSGMRGSGKTSELAKIANRLNHANGFFCVTCNLDDNNGLDLNDMEYMDILIFQLERLFEELKKHKLTINEGIISSLQKWFNERIKEVDKSIKGEGGFEIGVEAKSPSILTFLGLTTKLKGNLSGSKTNATKIRTVFKTNFTDFARKFNEFIEHVNIALRKNKIALEVLFIVDGLEKVATKDMRRKIVDEESNRIRQVKVHTIFTLPIELMALHQKLQTFSDVIPFPFVKIKRKDGTLIKAAVAKFEEFVYKRIDKKLFDSPITVEKAILHGGGSPRELLRILNYAYLFADEDKGIIDINALNKGIKKLAAQSAQYLSEEDLEQLKKLKENNEKGLPTPFNQGWQNLLEKLIVLEYNDGTYKRVNPIIEASQLYQQYVG